VTNPSALHQDLARLAAEARTRAYAPYSCFAVGAAVLGQDGRVFTGCNVENASYGLTVCAERTAIFRAIAEGASRLAALAVSAVPAAWPCGACRQVLAEFADPTCPVIVAEGGKVVAVTTLSELLPQAFSARGQSADFSARALGVPAPRP